MYPYGHLAATTPERRATTPKDWIAPLLILGVAVGIFYATLNVK